MSFTLSPTFLLVLLFAGLETPLPAALPLFASGLGLLGVAACRRGQKFAA